MSETGRQWRSTLRHTDEWFQCWTPLPNASLRLFCLPHAGGGTHIYREWARRLAPDIEVVAIRLPGREQRYDEAPYTRLKPLVLAIVAAIGPQLDRPHAYFGHSMGAWLAFEVCRAARLLGLSSPERLLVSGAVAPHIERVGSAVHDASAEDLTAHVRQLNGTPAELLDAPDAVAALLPTLRADYSIVETYRYRDQSPLSCPISAFHGVQDEHVTAEGVDSWRHHTSAEFTTHLFDGDHFFINPRISDLLDAVQRDLALAGRVDRIGVEGQR